MGKHLLLLITLLSLSFSFYSCDKDLQHDLPGEDIAYQHLDMISNLGFDATSAVDMGDHYVVEGDIRLDKAELPKYQQAATRQAHTNYTVAPGNAWQLKIKIDPVLNGSSNWRSAILTAMQHYNNTGSGIYMYEVASNPDITISYGYIGAWAQGSFPSADGKAGKTITVTSDPYINANGLSLSQKIFLIAHEMGHNLGFRHTDYLTSYPNHDAEGESIYGAHHIPGTPTGTSGSKDPNSVFNSGYFYNTTVMSWRGFSAYDLVAIKYMYPGPQISGPKYVAYNSTATFTISNLPANSTVTWSGKYIFTLQSGQGTTSATFRTPAQSPGLTLLSEFGKVSAVVTAGGFNRTVEHNTTWVGAYNLGKLIKTPATPGNEHYFKITYDGNVPADKVKWLVSSTGGGGYNSQYHPHTKTLEITCSPGNFTVTAHTTDNPNGNDSKSISFKVLPTPGNPGGGSIPHLP